MIKSVIIFVLGLLILPLVSAEISIQGPEQSVMNIGDEMVVSGYVLGESDMMGTLRLFLQCADSQQLVARSLVVNEGEQKTFSEKMMVPSYKEGKCSIKVTFEVNSQIVDEALSHSFTISKSLSGSVSIDKSEARLGESVKVSGLVTKLDGTPLNGAATITMSIGEDDVWVDTFEVPNGKVAYGHTFREMPSGDYAVTVEVSDIFGNKKLFDVGILSIKSGIIIFAESNKLHFMPGEKVKIEGEATILDELLKSGKVSITIDENIAEGEVSRGKFEKTIQIPQTITSGTQQLKVVITDEFGNYGERELSIIIDPKAKKIEIMRDKESYIPGDVVKVTPIIFDQAGQVIETEIGIIIKDPKDNEVYTDAIFSNTPYEFQLLESALPGAWVVEAFAMDLEAEINVLVGEKVQLVYTIDNSVLLVWNKGNVKFSGPIKIDYDGGGEKLTLVKEMVINRNETKMIDLAKDVKPGAYNINVNGQVFSNAMIADGGANWLVIILSIIVLILFLILMWYLWELWKQKKRRPKRTQWKNEKAIGPSFSMKSKDEVSSFKQRMSGFMEDKKKKIGIRIPKKNEDEFIFELPSRKKQEYIFPETSKYGKNREWPSSFEAQEPKREEKSEKKGLFDMFG